MNIEKTIEYREGGNRLVWRHPNADFNGAVQLIVNESQEALFFVNGQALDLFGAGRHLIGTHNYPQLDAFLREGEQKEGLFHAEVYFANKTVQSSIKWGLQDRIRFVEPTLGVPLEIGVSGEMFLQVSDTRKLIVKLLGTGNELTWSGDHQQFSKSLQAMFLPVVSMAVRESFAKCVVAEQMDLFTIDEYKGQLSETLRKSILPVFEEYGLTVPRFMVENLVLPEGDPAFKEMRELRLEKLRLAKLEAEVSREEVIAGHKARVVAANRAVELEQKKTELEIAQMDARKAEIEANAQAKKRVIEASANAETIRTVGVAEAEVMERKGVTEKDYLKAKVQSDLATALGNGGDGVTGTIVSAKIAKEMGEDLAKEITACADRQNSISCAVCGAVLAKDAKFCHACAAPVASASNGEAFCPACGKTVSSGKFCSACGAPLERACIRCGKTLGSGAKFCSNCGKEA